MDQNPKLLSTFNDKPTAYMQNNISKILADDLFALRKAREVFISSENLEKINHVLNNKYIQVKIPSMWQETVCTLKRLMKVGEDQGES